MSSGDPKTKVQSFLLACLLVASAFTMPQVAVVRVAAEDVGNHSADGVWPTKQGGSDRTGYVADAVPAANNPVTAWQAVQDDVIGSSPAVGNHAVYVGSETKDRVYALNATDGTERWSFEASGNVGSPTVAHGAVYVGDSTGQLYALHPANGSVIWNRSVGDDVLGSPVVVDHTVYVTAANDDQINLWRLDGDDGHDRWKYSVSGNAGSEPTVRDDRVYVTIDGAVHALGRTAGNNHWTTSLDSSGGLSGPTAGSEGIVVVDHDPAANDGTVYSLGADAGNVQWSHDTPTEPVGSAALAHGTVYVAVADAQSAGLVRLDARNGTASNTSFSYDLRTSPVVAENTVFVGTDRGLLAANATSGTERYFHEVPDDGTPTVASAPAVGNEAVYFGLNRTNDSVQKVSGDGLDYPPNAVVEAPSYSERNETVTLRGGESTDFDGEIVTYEWDVDDDGTFEKTGGSVEHVFETTGEKRVTLRVVDDEGMANSTSANVTVFDPTKLNVTNYSVSETNVTTEDTLVVNATVENTGDFSGSRDVTFYDDGEARVEQEVTVAAHDTATVSFSVTFNHAGNHAVTVGNHADLDTTRIEVTDATAPSPPGPVTSDGWSTVVDLQWDESGDVGTAVSHYEVRVGDGEWQNVGNTLETTLEVNRSGTFDGAVRAVDESGNAGPAANTTVKVDTEPPTAPDLSAPDGWVTSENLTVSASNSTDRHSGFNYYHVYVDGDLDWTRQRPNVTVSFGPDDLSTGTHTVEFAPSDKVGHFGPGQSVVVQIDETSPSVSVAVSNDAGTSTLVVNVTDPHSGITPRNVSLTVDGTTVSGLSVEGDSVVYTENVTPGTHYVEVTANDNVSNGVAGIWSVTANEPGGSDDGSGGDGSDGGGGGGGSSVPPPSVQVEVTERTESHVRAKITNARADAPATVPLSGLESGRASFRSVRVAPKSEDAQPRFFLDATAVEPPSASALSSDEALGALRVETTYIGSDELASVTVRFRVPTDAASPDEVTLYRYRDGEWTALPTEFVGKRGGEYAFRATADGVSLFGVGVTHEATATTATTSDGNATANGTATTEAALEDGTATGSVTRATTGASESIPGFGPLAALVALAVVAARRR